MGVLEGDPFPAATLVPPPPFHLPVCPQSPCVPPWWFPPFPPPPYHSVSSLCPPSPLSVSFLCPNIWGSPSLPQRLGPALLLPRGWGAGRRVC